MIVKCTAIVHYGDIGRNHHFMDLDVGMLKRTYSKLKTDLHCQVSQSDYDSLGPKLRSIEELSRVENRSISLYDIHQARFLLQVDRHMELLGFSKEEQQQSLSSERYHAMIHPDDIALMYDSEIKMYYFLKAHHEHIKDYKLVYDYRVRNKNGTAYIRFLHQMTVFESDTAGNAWIMLIISDVLDHYPEDEQPCWFLIETKNQRVCLSNEKQASAEHIITNREREILALAAQGLDSNSIAKRLCISLHTVNNHRQNILRKTHTRNMTQATYYLKCIGIL